MTMTKLLASGFLALTLALGLAVSIIGIPFAIQHVKLAMLALMPFGVEVREVR